MVETLIKNVLIRSGASSTFTVAASDSPARSKVRADYVCDGVNDKVEIQAALDALPSQGGKVFCMAGAYSIQDTIEIPDNTTLEFENGSTITVPGTTAGEWTFKKSAPFTKNGDNVYCMFTNDDHAGGNTRIKVIGANIDFGSGTGETIKYDGYYGAAGDAATTVWAAIWFENCTESIIEDCTAIGMLREGDASKGRQFCFLISSSIECSMRHCEANDSGYEGFAIRGANNNIFIDDCWGTNHGAHVAQAASWSPAAGGALIGKPEDIIFNNIRGLVAGDGLTIHGDNSYIPSGIIVKNCILGYIKAIGAVSDVIISSNTTNRIEVGTVNANGTVKGVGVVNNIIDANTEPANYAISIVTSTLDGGNIKDIVLNGNVITDGRIQIQNGLVSDLTPTSDITGVEVLNNTFILKNQTELDLILIRNYGAADLTDIGIRNNSLISYTSGTDNSGILFWAGTANDIKNIDIISNRFHCYYPIEVIKQSTGQVLDVRIINNRIWAGNVALRFDSNTSLVGATVRGNWFESMNYGMKGGANIVFQNNDIAVPGSSFEVTSPLNVTYLNNNVQPPIALTTGSRTLQHYESGLTFTTIGAGATATFVLPPARVGIWYRFIVGAAQELRIDPDGTETVALNNSQQAAGSYVTANAVGETILYRCIKAGEWEDFESLGTWTVQP